MITLYTYASTPHDPRAFLMVTLRLKRCSSIHVAIQIKDDQGSHWPTNSRTRFKKNKKTLDFEIMEKKNKLENLMKLIWIISVAKNKLEDLMNEFESYLSCVYTFPKKTKVKVPSETFIYNGFTWL